MARETNSFLPLSQTIPLHRPLIVEIENPHGLTHSRSSVGVDDLERVSQPMRPAPLRGRKVAFRQAHAAARSLSSSGVTGSISHQKSEPVK
jgi:hypothetical protein